MNRQVINRLLAKCLAYHECGKPELANQYANALVHYLHQHGIDTTIAFERPAQVSENINQPLNP